MKKRLIRLGAAAAAFGALVSMGGCASVITPVQPWKKGTLARPEMAFDGDKLENRFNEHIYDSREAASGGAGVGGGGCGCN